MRDTFHPMFFERTSRIVVDYFKHFTIFFMWICLSRCVITPQKNQIRMNVFCVSVVHFLYFMFPMRRAIQSNSLDKFWCLMITIIITTTKTALSPFQSFSLCIKNWVKLKRRPICKRNIQKILYIQSIVKWYAFYWFFFALYRFEPLVVLMLQLASLFILYWSPNSSVASVIFLLLFVFIAFDSTHEFHSARFIYLH